MSFLAFDCEGPLTLNDNAFEYCKAIVPEGDRFFKQISRFDDYLADIKKKEGYKAGDTLKLILPFLKLFGADNRSLKEFSKRTLFFLPGIPETLQKIKNLVPIFIISTSYRPYLEALAEVVQFPMECIFCTEVDFDRIKLSPAESKVLNDLYNEILGFPDIELSSDAKFPSQLPGELLSVLERLEEIFFDIIWNMDVGIFLREVNPVGGLEKAKACKLISEKLGIPLSHAFYTGDSITDMDAFSLVKSAGGITLSFNGNRYALKSAEFYALSNKGFIFKHLTEIFLEKGKEGIERHRSSEDYEFGKIPDVKEEFDKLVKKSEDFRKAVRGEVIGGLG